MASIKRILEMIRDNPGIRQIDVIQHLNHTDSQKICRMNREKYIEREPLKRTFMLFITPKGIEYINNENYTFKLDLSECGVI